jgi:hypothetical protein
LFSEAISVVTNRFLYKRREFITRLGGAAIRTGMQATPQRAQ